MANKKSNLPISFESVKPVYDKPVKSNRLVPDENYKKIDDTALEGVKVCTNGVVYIDEDLVPPLLQENASDTEYLLEKRIPKDKFRTDPDTGKELVHTSPLVGLLDERCQECRDPEKKAIQQYSRDTLTNINDSDQAESMRRKVDSRVGKEQKKLRSKRNSDVDEVTGDPLEKGHHFHHANQKSLHTDPEKSIDPEEGVLVNPSTHKEIHKNKIRDKESLEGYTKEVKKKCK